MDSAPLAVYRGNLAANWRRALANAYPVVEQLVGEEFFGGLARAYGKAHPSQDPDLNRFGERFAAFLDGFAPAADLPWLGDMARLEWALHLAWHAPDAAPLSIEALAGFDPARLADARLILHPACALLPSRWAVAQLWLAHQEHGPGFPETLDAPCCALVTRRRWKGEVTDIGRAEHLALARLAEGDSIAGALDAALADAQERGEALPDVGAMLRRWFGLGVVAAIAADDVQRR